MSSKNAIAIIGSGCRFPGNANSPSKLWEILHNPPDLSSTIPEGRFKTQGFFHKDPQYHGHTNVDRAYLLSGSEEGVYRQFDAQFFGISTAEARVMDPQVRLLLETVFEALESGGQTIEDLQGSNTAVYSGLMTGDYEHMMTRDEDTMSTYHVTGTSRALMSNRISYFFDWRGPSMTIDTACSSSLYAVHQAVQQLRSGASRVAVATGANLILDPILFITESKMQMLSPTGRSRMWDADADGYARGEGVAAIVMKTLEAAEADGDPIECIIRETAVGQDGRTKGITVPNSEAQATMIVDCYRRAGLDICRVEDRPQYFEAHGTGTAAGDPEEARAIHSAFFSSETAGEFSPLLVGSAKTVIGHTEGTAGLAGILKASLALRNSIIPPNLLFNRLNPRVAPFYGNLQIPTSAVPWPTLPTGCSRRASINSFGFGGANAHAILESYSPVSISPRVAHEDVFYPFLFSAVSEKSLIDYLEVFQNYLIQDGNDVDIRDLSYTLNYRRTRFPLVVTFSASTIKGLASRIGEKIDSVRSKAIEHLGTPITPLLDRKPRVLVIFTGQGAQWPRMGAELIESSAYARVILKRLEARLARLPAEDRPTWSLTEELLKAESSSQVSSAFISQPLCTAIQIVLVELLRRAGVEFTAIVGHSSGEIAAAYASGLISADDAICIAYYRGLYSDLASGSNGQSGAMLAVGTSFENVQELLDEDEFQGRACIAAINSSDSVTIAGDSDAIEEIEVIFRDERVFTRPLRVSTAYHSHHMVPCSPAYLDALRRLDIQVQCSSQTGHPTWYSSVQPGDIKELIRDLHGPYWDRNMVSPVLFQQAVARACAEMGSFDLAIEVGPHPALKGPALQTIQEILEVKVPYTSLLQRKRRDLEALALGVGHALAHLGKGSVDLRAYALAVFEDRDPSFVNNLPTYCWNHEIEYWHESRYTKAIRSRSDRVHELLGHQCPDSTQHEIRWRHMLRPKEIPWMKGHQLQGQIVFPAAGYVTTALEAAHLVFQDAPILCIDVLDLEIEQALTFDDEDTMIETLFSMTDIQRHGTYEATAKFTHNAARAMASGSLSLLASGRIRVRYGEPSATMLPTRNKRVPHLMKVQEKHFYDALRKLDYQYSGPFVALSGIERRLGTATGYISTVEDSTLIVHPAVLDVAFQSVFLAACAPDDGTLWSMHVPTRVRRVSINPLLCLSEMDQDKKLPFDATQVPSTKTITGDVEVYPAGSEHGMIQVEGLECVPFTPATEKNDRALFNSTIWTPMLPDVEEVAFDGEVTDEQRQLAQVLERMAYYYLRQLDESVPANHPSRQQGSYVQLFKFASHALSHTTITDKSVWRPEWEQDTLESISSAYLPYEHIIDVRILNAIGSRLTNIATGEVPAIEIGTKDQLLTEYYQNGLGMWEYTKYLARVIKQITLKTPRLRCLEIGAGTGGATKAILAEAGQYISSYTFTDISSGFFENAQVAFADFADRLVFKALDICADPREQGFDEYSYDVIVASAVLHATPALNQTLQNVRRLLKPGGYLAVVEVDSSQPMRIGTMFGAFPGWWLGVEEGRDLSPCLSLADWDDLLQRTGFSGCDTTMSSPEGFVNPLTLFVTQKLDDKISFLRDPISDGPQIFHPGHAIRDLVVIGGANPSTFKLALRASRILRRYCGNIKTIKGLEDVQGLSISSHTTILSLVELDRDVFRDITEGRWNALKRILQDAGTILWVTHGRRASNPYANMTCGFFRSVTHERPALDYQCLDVEDTKSLTPEVLAKVLLQFQAAVFWRRNSAGNFDIAIERELVMDRGGRMLVPRLIANQEMTRRHNAIRRPILQNTDLRDYDVSVMLEGSKFFLRKDTRKLPTFGRVGNVTHSTVTPIRLTRQSRMFLALGKYGTSSEQFMQLSLSNSATAYPGLSLPLLSAVPPGSEALFLRLVTLHHVASTIVQDLEDGDRVLVHEPDPALILILKNSVINGDLSDVKLLFTTSRPDGHPACLRIHSHLPTRASESLKLHSITTFIDFSVTEESKMVAREIRTRLPKSCRSDDATSLFGGEPKAPSRARADHILNHLKNMMRAANRGLENISGASLECKVIGINDISNHDYSEASQCILDWNTADQVVSTRVEPIDSQPLFVANRTYWLVGLTGSLALSLCKWMVLHGARYVVLSSRKPKIDKAWEEEMAELGAVIKIMATDITKKEGLREAYEEISSTLPSIVGVAQGAMVLRDNLIRDIPLEDVYEVTRPKVEGSIYLNELFQKHPLDFFVFLSSLSSVLGIPGQSCYTAANLFMLSLAAQRKQAGLAASVINIGIVYGAGYVTEQQRDMTSISLTMATIPMSERDFHQMFAEAVIAGSPGTSTLAEISAGPRPVQIDEEIQPKWAPNPFFTHLLVDVPTECSDSAATNRKKTVSLETQLLEARTVEDVHHLIKTAILEKLRTMFQFDSDMLARTGLDAIRLDDLGVDSLMAVEIRSWMAKSLRINYPVLKILSGVSIGELVRVGVDGVPPEMVPGLQSQTSMPLAPLPKVNGHGENGYSNGHANGHVNGHMNGQTNGQVNGIHLEPIPASSSVSTVNGHGPIVKDAPSPDILDPAKLTFMDLSPTQQMFWLSSNMLNGNASLNHTAMFKLTGPLRVHDLEMAVKKVGEEHESLRTCFMERHGRLMQAIMEKSTLYLEHMLIYSEDEAQQAAHDVHQHAYDIGRGQTLRLVLLSLSDSERFLVFGCTGLALDGVSFQVFLQDLLQHYHQENDVPETAQYRDFLQIQDCNSNPGHFEKEIQYWNRKYLDFPPPLPVLRVSSATSRPSLASFGHERVSLNITRKTKLQIQSICKRYRVTPFHFYLACLRVLLTKYADVDDVSIGIGDANRSDDRMMRCIGTFFNVLPLRFKTQSGAKFNELLKESCAATYEAMENSRLPFQTLLHELKPPRSPTHTTLFQSFINYRVGQRRKQTWGSCELEMKSYEISQTGYDLNLDIIDDPEGECFLALYVRRELYGISEAETLIRSYGKLVSSFAATPDIDCGEAYMYDSNDVRLALDFSEGPTRLSKWPETTVHQIEAIADEYPNRPAVRSHDGCITTYSQLLKLSRTIASALTAAGADLGSVIAVLQEPSLYFIASILAIMRIGAVYLPLDLFAPASRLVAIVDNCKPKLFLIDTTTNHRIHEMLGSQPAAINVSLLDMEPQPKTPIAATADGLAMILYTSGSTGAPKGISLKHEGIRNQIEHMQDIYDIGAEVVLQQSAPSFDLSYAQIFMGLCFGGSVYPLPSGLRGDAFAITELIASQGITCTFATPTEYSSWQKYAQGTGLVNSSWKTALCAGEPVPHSLLAQFKSLNKSDLRLFNAYGPTEVSVLASALELKYMDDVPYQGIVPAGSVLPNYSIHILDEQFNHVPPGVQGEVYIGGAGVAAGYVHNPVLSAERFVLDPFASDHFTRHGWTRMHRVGDRGRWREDGSIVIEGRISGDTQVKIRGIRVDLCEVEDAILRVAQGALTDAVVSVRRSHERSEDASQFLVAHVVFDPKHPEQEREAFLQQLPSALELPSYMRPVGLFALDRVPRTASSKLDRRAIGALELPEVLGGYEESRLAWDLTQTEGQLRDIWFDVVKPGSRKVYSITPQTDFFDIGGNSLLLLDVKGKIQAIIGKTLQVGQMLQSSTLGHMASLIERGQGPASNAIDWESETALPQSVIEAGGAVETVTKGDGLVVVLTGATGYLGSAILDALVTMDEVNTVHCIGVRDMASRKNKANSPKVHFYEGNLKLPRIGLSEDDARRIFGEADRIIHNGADTSHMRYYQSMRLPNVQSTRELVKMCGSRHIPIHFVSTAAISPYYAAGGGAGQIDFPEVSLADYPPPTDGFGGYPASKWASERLLERLHGEVEGGWPVFIHRPSLISRQLDNPALDVVHNIRHYATRLNAVPVAPNISGYLDTVALSDVVRGILDALRGPHATTPDVRFFHYCGEEQLPLDDMKSWILTSFQNGDGELATRNKVGELQLGEWARRAAVLGMDPTLVAFVASVAGQRELGFPKVIKKERPRS